MGLLDLPAPVLSAIDGWLAGFLPVVVRLVFWAAVTALLGMELYRLLSPQERIAGTRLAFEQSRRRVAEFEGEFEDAWPHIRAMFSSALRRLALAFPATIVAALPFLVAIVWLDTRYGNTYPPLDIPAAITVPGEFEGRWVAVDGGVPRAAIADRSGVPVAEVPVAQPVPVIHKRRWWNALIGNPAGYLPEELPFDRVDIALPRRQVLSLGPDWLRDWEVVFLAASILFAVAFKTVRRIV